MEIKTHKLSMANRKNLTLTGVKDVRSFDMSQVWLETVDGVLLIKGKELKVGKLDIETGEVDVDGTVDSLTYSDSFDVAKTGKSIIKRLFN